MKKRKLPHRNVDLTITHFLLGIPERQHQVAIEYIISQYVALLADSPGKLQHEHFVGLNAFSKELSHAALSR